MYGCKKCFKHILTLKYKLKIKFKDNIKYITDLCSMLV